MSQAIKSPFRLSILSAALLLGTLGGSTAFAADINVTLSGANEVPPVTTSASGGGTITLGDDGSVQAALTRQGSQAPPRTSTKAPRGRMDL